MEALFEETFVGMNPLLLAGVIVFTIAVLVKSADLSDEVLSFTHKVTGWSVDVGSRSGSPGAVPAEAGTVAEHHAGDVEQTVSH